MTLAMLSWFNATAPNENHKLKLQDDGGLRCICDRLVIAPSAVNDWSAVRDGVMGHWNEERK